MTIVIKCIIVLVLIGILILIWGYSETRRYKITDYTVDSDKRTNLQKQTMVFLTDLHDHVYKDHNAGLLRDIREQKPCVILIGGDMLIGAKNYDSRQALSFVKSLTEIAPVYYALGNHEQRMKEDPGKYADYWTGFYVRLREAGVHFLDNENARIHLPGEADEICLSGLTIPSECYHKIHHFPLEKSTIEELLGKEDLHAYGILMAHNPAYIDTYRNWGANLILCGHFHGGIARIPGWRGMISPQFHFFPKYSGEMSVEGQQTIIVSRGMGTHTIPLRFFNLPELIVIHF